MQALNLLVTGGAGYVGSHAARHLVRAGHQVWIYDNLSRGHALAAQRAAGREALLQGDVCDTHRLRAVLSTYRIDAVVHFAGLAQVGESVERPEDYYRHNVAGTLSLLEAMCAAGVKRLIFSSTTATYGKPCRVPIAEDAPQQPINPYGFSKLVVERMLHDFARAHRLAYVALRYFNAAGASPEGDLGEDHEPETHLIPLVLQVALGQRTSITIHGHDYPTPDGTCIRDFVHVEDLAVAHCLALKHLHPGRGLHLNLGSGRGHSVREVVEACRRITGHEIPAVAGPRRPGDPAALVADIEAARRTLGWTPQHSDLDWIVATAWQWHRRHPLGFRSLEPRRKVHRAVA
jgi:UDP-glucose 4-epimerase